MFKHSRTKNPTFTLSTQNSTHDIDLIKLKLSEENIPGKCYIHEALFTIKGSFQAIYNLLNMDASNTKNLHPAEWYVLKGYREDNTFEVVSLIEKTEKDSRQVLLDKNSKYEVHLFEVDLLPYSDNEIPQGEFIVDIDREALDIFKREEWYWNGEIRTPGEYIFNCISREEALFVNNDFFQYGKPFSFYIESVSAVFKCGYATYETFNPFNIFAYLSEPPIFTGIMEIKE